MNQSFDNVDFPCFWTEGIPTDVLTSKRWFPVNVGEESSAPFLPEASEKFKALFYSFSTVKCRAGCSWLRLT